MLDRRKLPRRRATLAPTGATTRKAFVEELRQRGVTPHIAPEHLGTAQRHRCADTHHPGYAKSLRFRKRIEECFGWIKTVGGGRKLRYIGQAKNQLWATFTAIGFNLVRMSNLEAQAT